MNSEVEAAFERLSATVPAETHAMLRTCSAALGVYQLVREPVICEFAEGWREAPVSAGMVEAFNDWRAKREQYWRANREQ